MTDEAHGFCLRHIGPGHTGDGGDAKAVNRPAGDTLFQSMAILEDGPYICDSGVSFAVEARRVGGGAAFFAQADKEREKCRMQRGVVDTVAFDAEADGAGHGLTVRVEVQGDVRLGVNLSFGDAAALPAGDVEGVAELFVVGMAALGFDECGDEFKLGLGQLRLFPAGMGAEAQAVEGILDGIAAGDGLAHEQAHEVEVVEAGVVAGHPDSGVRFGAPLDIGRGVTPLKLPGNMDFVLLEEGGQIGPAAFPDGVGVAAGRVLTVNESRHPERPLLALNGRRFTFLQGALGLHLQGAAGVRKLIVPKAGGFAADLAQRSAVFDPPVGRAGTLVEGGHELSVPQCDLGGNLKLVLDWFEAIKMSKTAEMELKGNYGLYFNVWDRLMGTNHPDYEARFREVTTRPKTDAVG